jgi:excisionase family DNA binding protein
MTTTTLEPATRSRGRAHRYRDVAKMLNCSPRSVMRLVESGQLKAVYLGPHSPRIFDADIDAFIAAQGGDNVL